MRVYSDKILPGALTGLLGAFLLTAAPAAQAQAGRSIRCESKGGQFNRCAVPWRDAELVRQESKGACTRGRSWGMDRQGLWVDHGCRGQFAEVRGRHGPHDRNDHIDRSDDDHRGGRGDRWRPGADWNREIRMGCDSNGKRYTFCQVDVGANGRVRLVQQQSDSRCTLDYSWGWNRAGIWTDHGCRGEFAVDRRW